MNSWIFPSNPKMYDVFGAFNDLPYVYWTQRVKNIKVGDYVYIYMSSPVSRIVYRCVVEETDVPFSSEVMNDKDYWRNGCTFNGRPLTHMYIKLRPLERNDNEQLNFWGLRSHGETSYLMGQKMIKDDKYLAFVESFFKD